jgi:cysteinyl-tRNA synthetase
MLKLYNTLSRRLETFRSIRTKKVGLYTCGPTVYQVAHIGNLRAYIFADILRRTLEFNGYKVKHVMNITDVGHLTGDRDMGEDKVESEARKKKKSALDITKFYTIAFFEDLNKLNILSPHLKTKATETIDNQIALVKKLEAKVFTYKTSDGIYFDTAKLKDYGKLAQLDIEGLKEGARIEANPEKKNPTDFALWKFSPKGEQRQMEWESPWGVGSPGWHIECSAISTKHLGQPFDIHTGGIDHIPVHHTNEIAQSEAAYDKPLANYWLHGEFLILDKTRMGKSEGNLIALQTVIDKGFTPLAYRYYVLGAHYRTKLNFSWQALEAAQNGLDNLYGRIREYEAPKIGSPDMCAEYQKRFEKAINNDLDTPQALAITWDLIKADHPSHAKKQTLLRFDKVLGLGFDKIKKEKIEIPKEIQDLLNERESLRQKNEFEQADQVRKKINKLGFDVEDTAQGPRIKRV